MPEITANTKVILGAISAGSAIVAALSGYLLSATVVAILSGRPGSTARRPAVLWLIFFVAAALSLMTGSIATFAPQVSDHSLPTQEARDVRLIANQGVEHATPPSALHVGGTAFETRDP
ncbi:MAG TPA: hypothetical protein VMJ64_05950 [Anaerolineales bacterium]|nr:hypothetical protein [Anaerolineales bacterium]